MNEFHLMILEKASLSCQDIEDVMGDYADQELGETLRSRVDAHIESCETCQDLRWEYMKTIELAQGLRGEAPKMPKEVHERLREALRERLGF